MATKPPKVEETDRLLGLHLDYEVGALERIDENLHLEAISTILFASPPNANRSFRSSSELQLLEKERVS